MEAESHMNSNIFIDVWKSEDYEQIYMESSQEFKELITLPDFLETSRLFSKGVSDYSLESRTYLQSIQQDVWVDDQSTRILAVSYDEKETIVSLYLKPSLSFPETDTSYTKNSYIMPIMDDWVIFWGGKNEFINYHYAYENQRYAYDLLKIQNDSTFEDDPEKNNNYYAFGEEIIAPQDGEILKVVDGIEDNIPGQMNQQNPAGNYVVIEHANKEYSMIAHFQKDTIIVQEGEKVIQKQLLGKCGNSGNSSEAHIHFQIMSSPDFENSKSIPIKFSDEKEPIQGDIVTNNLLKYENHFDDRVEKVENSFDIAETIMAIAKAIVKIFKL